MKEKRYTLPNDNQPCTVSEPTPRYHGNAAVALPDEDVSIKDFEDEDFNWDRIPYLDSPTNAEEAEVQIKSIEKDDEKAGINYTVNEFFQELQKTRAWQ